VLALALLAGAATGLLRWANQPIERLVVTGRLQHVTPVQVEQAVRAHLKGAGLLTVNLSAISRGLSALPWIDTATVRRSWPRGLSIQIVEQTAVARWDSTGLLNGRGELFLPQASVLPPELPDLNGPAGAEQEVTTRYLTMQGRLTEIGLRLNTLTLDARGDWSFALNDGVLVRLGRTHVDTRFDRFVQAAASLVHARAPGIAYVDMRYGNGFAVGWKGPAGPAARTGDHSHFNG
jgi:cell division protein FtsQ